MAINIRINGSGMCVYVCAGLLEYLKGLVSLLAKENYELRDLLVTVPRKKD